MKNRDKVDYIFEIVHQNELRCGIKAVWDDEVSDFGVLIMPVPNCFEIPSYGPVPIREVEYLLINPIIKQKIKDRPALLIDKSSQLSQEFTKKSITYELVEGLFRIQFS